MAKLGRILVVDDEKNITIVIQAMLERAGFETICCNNGAQAIEVLAKEKVNVVVTDLYMPGQGGMEVLEFCRNNMPGLPVVIITAFGSVESAVAALKKGAFDFITKPFDQAELIQVVQKAYATHQQNLKEPVNIAPGPVEKTSSIIGESSPIQEVFKVISKIAASPATVLIWGESGTGKELVAYEIHRNSLRFNKPFIKINCAAIPATLIESELFGYEKGAFTGAVTSKPGRFELAHEGTLFLDEVADMPLEMQVKLLRVLQEQEFERVGGVNPIRTDVRIIAATNKDLATEVKAGRFREDLFYRLNVVPIHLPALRERREDIELLAGFFVKQFNQKLNKNILRVEPACMDLLRHYNWPGNIRQLENVLERMILMSDGMILDVQDLPSDIASASAALKREIQEKAALSVPSPAAELLEGSASFKEIVRKQTQNVEREIIEKVLEDTGGNVTRAAEKLGLSRKGLQLKIKELALMFKQKNGS